MFAAVWMLGLLFGASVAHGQAGIRQLIDSPGETRPELPELVEDDVDLERLGRVLPQVEIPLDDREAAALAGGEIEVRAFRFSGNSAFTDAELAEVVADYVGPGRRYSALLEARDRVTRTYIDAGFVNSGAVLPQQGLEDGVVEIQVVEGELSRIRVREGGRLRDRYIESRLLGDGSPLNVNTLRERLKWLKRDPRIDGVTAELTPGTERGASLLTVSVDEAQAWWATAQADNSTPASIGEFRGLVQAGHRNVTGWGDSFTLGYSVTEGLHDVEARLEIPLNRWETTFEATGRYAETDVVEPALSELELSTETSVLGVRLRHPVLRSNRHEVRVFVGADRRTGRASIGGDTALLADLVAGFGSTRVTAIRTGVEGWWRGRSRALSGRATLSFGVDLFGATNGTNNGQPDPEFVTGLFQLQGVEYLPWAGMRLHSRVDFQVSDGPLLGLEQFAAGGDASVRGFRTNLLVRDQGAAASLELRIPLVELPPLDRLELGIFTDYAYGRNLGDTPTTEANSENLLSVGGGLHADVTRYVEAFLQYGYAIIEPDGNNGDALQDHGVHFRVRVRFP